MISITLDLPETIASDLMRLPETERIILLSLALEARTRVFLSRVDRPSARLSSPHPRTKFAEPTAFVFSEGQLLPVAPGEGQDLLNWKPGEHRGSQVACTTGGYYVCDLPMYDGDGADYPHTRLRFFSDDVTQAVPLPLYQERGAYTDLLLRAKQTAEEHRQERGDRPLSTGA